MLSLKVDKQASLLTQVFSEWGLSTSLDDFVDEAKKRAPVSPPQEALPSHNNTISFTIGSAQMAAYTPMEDKLYLNKEESLFAVFDGHGGDICSKYVVDRVPKQLLNAIKTKKPQTEADYTKMLKSTFMSVDEQFLNEHKHVVKTSASGSCGVSVLVRNNTLYVCNLGDSRVLMGSTSETETWSHELLTNDHNTKNEKERQLVKQRTTDPMPIRGHAVQKVEGERVGGVLMVTRAFGDGIFKRRDMSIAPFIPHLPYITNEPEVTVRTLTSSDKYAVISSDGLYEYFTPAEVAAIVEKQLETTTDGTKIAAELIERKFEKIAALATKTVEHIKGVSNRKEFMDDISIIILVFSHPIPSGNAVM